MVTPYDDSRIKIETDVPLPDCVQGKWARLLSKLNHGDSFFVKRNTANDCQNARAAIGRTAKGLGIKIITKTLEGGFRVWRVNDCESRAGGR